MKGLFVNQVKNNCSIYESGVMIYNALKLSKHTIEYMEISTQEMNSYPYSGYDFYVFNWHHNTLPISPATLSKVNGLRIGIVLEVGPFSMRPFMPENIFDAYMVIDPSKGDKTNHYIFPRPLEKVDNLLPLLSEDVPVFGTFGFLVPGKNFGEVLNEANKYGKDCILRINLPEATFTGRSFNLDASREFGRRLHSFKNRNVDLRVTHDYMSKPDLIRWCSQHTINIFPYYRSLPGLSAVTDQAIVANRGIAVTDCDTFRHMHKYINHFPNESYVQLSQSTLPGIKQMQIDWSNDNFSKKFDYLIRKELE
jgi:hypothetical protein